jgi:hypothetical protein
MISPAQAVTNLIPAPRPILFLDTCTLLDIVRAPLRDLTTAVRAGVELRALAANGTVRLFVQDIVPGEWTDNLPAARRVGEAGIRAFAATWQYPCSRVLASSNRSDFAAPNATVFHPDIVLDAAAAGLRYAISLEAAIADLPVAAEIP